MSPAFSKTCLLDSLEMKAGGIFKILPKHLAWNPSKRLCCATLAACCMRVAQQRRLDRILLPTHETEKLSIFVGIYTKSFGFCMFMVFAGPTILSVRRFVRLERTEHLPGLTKANRRVRFPWGVFSPGIFF